MKLILITAIALSAISASAFSKDSSWTQIFNARNLNYKAAHLEGLHGIDFSNACLSDNEVKSVKPVVVCTEWKQIDSGQESGPDIYCRKSIKKQVTYVRAHQMKKCLEYKDSSGEAGTGRTCIKYSSEVEELPKTVAVNVWSIEGGNTDFTKDFTFPKCN